MVDHISDKNNSILYKLYQKIEFPTFVKKATLLTEDDCKELPTSSFADVFSRKFPITSPADTWISNLFFDKIASKAYSDYKTEGIKQKLQEAANLWEIDLTITEKEAEELPLDSNYIVDTGTQKIRIFARTKEDIEKQACQLDNTEEYSVRKQTARGLLKVAKEIKVELEPALHRSLEKTAGYGITPIQNAISIIRGRKIEHTNPDILEKMAELETTLKENYKDFVPGKVLEKVAGFINAIDAFSNAHSAFGRSVPEQDLVTITLSDGENLEKKAVVLANNKLVSKRKLQENKEAVDKFLSEVCATEKLAEISSHEADILLDIIN
jgi:predicted house-cleaning noncanonical NTP pyrophosphatase (MazG superfamily)